MGLTGLNGNYPAYFTMRLTNHVQHQVRHGFSGFGVDIGVEPAARSFEALTTWAHSAPVTSSIVWPVMPQVLQV